MPAYRCGAMRCAYCALRQPPCRTIAVPWCPADAGSSPSILLNRRCRLLTDNIDALRAATRLTQTRHPFTIDAVVVLPDHIHAVWTLPPGDADFSLRWRLIKIDFAKAVPNTERRSAVRIARGERGICQPVGRNKRSALRRTGAKKKSKGPPDACYLRFSARPARCRASASAPPVCS